MRNSRMIQFAALALSAACLLGSAWLTPRILESRKELAPIASDEVYEQTPPEYAFAIQALGSFRSLLTNIAFIRAEMLKEQGRYFDAMQLANWICKLQPRFPTVWEFQSWNMAWNISVTTYTPEERWNWVYNGAKLIRDEGIEYNPRAVNLYKQLAWIFVNKMSEPIDEYHEYYKREWAWRMHLVLGPPPEPLGEHSLSAFDPLSDSDASDEVLKAAIEYAESRGYPEELIASFKAQLESDTADRSRSDGDESAKRFTLADLVRRAHYDRVQQIAEAPDTLDELFAQVPETRGIVAALRSQGVPISDDTLTEEAYWRPEGLAFRFFLPWRQLSEPAPLLARIEDKSGADRLDWQRDLTRFDNVAGVTTQNPAGEAVLRFLQKKVLHEVYRLDPDWMTELVREFGPLDWRTVDSQALYWTTRAITIAGDTLTEIKQDRMNVTRMIFFSLRNSYLRGNLTFEPYYNVTSIADIPKVAHFNLQPNLNFIPEMHKAYLKYGKLLDTRGGEGEGAGDLFRTGHVNFLSESVRMLWFAGRKREAAHYYQYLRDTYGRTEAGEHNPAFDAPLEIFVNATFLENAELTREANIAVSMFTARALDRLAAGDIPGHNRFVETARKFWDLYNQSDIPNVNKQRKMPPYPQIYADMVHSIFARPAPAPQFTLQKARMWQRIGSSVKQRLYDDVIDQLRAECEEFNFVVDEAFPAPPGLEQYREQRQKRREAEHEEIRSRMATD